MASLPVQSPPIPFLGSIPGGFRHGLMIRINGHMHAGGERFDVNLMCGPILNPMDDIALHMSVRPDEGDIVRNHYDDEGWYDEERDGGCPIQPGMPYEILILATSTSYRIAVNGIHLAEFNHRLPLLRVGYLHVVGDTNVNFIRLEGNSDFAPSAPVMPAYPPYGGY